jgi:NAD(P)-dependent dehydrogenase (short-subunit alcohol dehydrogenase family)
MKALQGRVAVVTGAAGGIGRALVKVFVNAGMKVVLAGPNQERLCSAVKAFKDDGAIVFGVRTDVSAAAQMRELARRTIVEFGAVHVLCNNAGVAYGGRSSWETPLEAWQWVLGVNLMGVIHGIHAFLPIMLKQDTEAHIVNMASNSGLIMNSHAVPYGVSKHAVVALSESLHLELLQRNARVKVSVVCPGPVSTGFLNSVERNRPKSVPLPPALTPEEMFLRKAYEVYISRGMDPGEIARQVLEALRTEQFYVIPHDYSDAINTRMQNILQRKNPGPQQPTPQFLEIVAELKNESNKTS